MPSPKSGFVSPFPMVTPAFVESLRGQRKNPRLSCGRVGQGLRKMMDDLDDIERAAPQDLKPLYHKLLDQLNAALQTNNRIGAELARRES